MEYDFKTTDEYIDYLNFMNSFNEMLEKGSDTKA